MLGQNTQILCLAKTHHSLGKTNGGNPNDAVCRGCRASTNLAVVVTVGAHAEVHLLVEGVLVEGIVKACSSTNPRHVRRPPFPLLPSTSLHPPRTPPPPRPALSGLDAEATAHGILPLRKRKNSQSARVLQRLVRLTKRGRPSGVRRPGKA